MENYMFQLSLTVLIPVSGFDLNVLQNSKGNGIHNSQARIVSLTGGSLNIASTPGTGTTVTIEIPQKRTF